MAQIEIPGRELRVGDRGLDADGGTAYTVLEVRPCTGAEARLWRVDGMKPGDIVAEVQWIDGGIGSRFYDPDRPMRVGRGE